MKSKNSLGKLNGSSTQITQEKHYEKVRNNVFKTVLIILMFNLPCEKANAIKNICKGGDDLPPDIATILDCKDKHGNNISKRFYRPNHSCKEELYKDITRSEKEKKQSFPGSTCKIYKKRIREPTEGLTIDGDFH